MNELMTSSHPKENLSYVVFIYICKDNSGNLGNGKRVEKRKKNVNKRAHTKILKACVYQNRRDAKKRKNIAYYLNRKRVKIDKDKPCYSNHS